VNVIHFEEIVGRDREDDIESNRRQRRTFQALTDTPQGGPDIVLAYAGVPLLGGILSYTDNSTGTPTLVNDASVVVIRRRAEQNDSDNLCNWTVTIEYTGINEPEAQPAEVEYSPTRYQEHLIDDVNGLAVVNSAGDPFAEGVMRDRTRFTLTITKNIPDGDWNPVTAATYQDTLNQKAFLVATHFPGFAAGTCKLTLSAKRVRKLGLTEFYWVRTATIDVDARGWNVKVRDAGMRQKKSLVDATRVPIISSVTGHPVSYPVPLDGDGFELPTGGVPQVVTFVPYETKDWTALGLEY
jgi:hypothetical protein